MLADSTQWQDTPSKPRPASGGVVSGGETLDQRPGWINQLNVQGVSFVADVYAVEELTDGSGGIRVSSINDDPAALPAPEGWRNARVWTFLPLWQDPGHGFQWNTRQSQVIYAEPLWLAQNAYDPPPEHTTYQPWTAFGYPPVAAQRFGIWLTDAQYAAHQAALTTHGWREWLP